MYPSKLGTFPPEVDLGVRHELVTSGAKPRLEKRRHIAVVVQPHELPELLDELRDAVYGTVEPARAPQATHRAYLAAVLAALSNAAWQAA